MMLQEAREQVAHYARRMIGAGLTVGTGGNLSIFDRSLGLMAITPSAVPYEELRPEDVVVLDRSGEVVAGYHKPSSEYLMHLLTYEGRPDANAMVHAHPPYATTIACLRQPLPAVDYLVAFAGGPDVPCAEYAPFGTRELAEKALQAMEGRNAVLLANHGMNVIGPTLARAFAIAEQLEYCARLYWQAKAIGEPVILPDDEMARMVERFKTYG